MITKKVRLSFDNLQNIFALLAMILGNERTSDAEKVERFENVLRNYHIID